MAHSANIMMDDMSDSQSSDSSESGTSSSASSNSSESEQSSQSLEPARILKQNLELPKGLCENLSIFNEFFSLDTWRCLPDHMKDQLKPLLPNFTNVCGNDKKEIQRETNATVQKLFTNQITRFESSPLIDFQRNLEEGNYRPDISRLQANIKKSQRREQRFQNCERISQLAKSLTLSCEQQLRRAYDGMAIEMTNGNKTRNSPNKLIANAAAIRSKKRYHDEISKIREEVGLDSDLSDDDENYPDGFSKKPKRNISNNQVGLTTGSEPRIISTMATKSSIQSSNQQSLVGNPDAEEIFQELLMQHKIRRQEDPEHIELDTSDIKISDIYARTYNTPGRKPTVKVPITTTDFDVSQIKSEPDLKMDHMETDLLAPVNSSFDIPTVDTSHISLPSQFGGLPRNNSFLDKISTVSPTINMKESLADLGQLKPEIKEEKIETDVCKQFLKDDDFKSNRSIESLDAKNRSGVMFSSIGNKEKKKQVYDVLIGNPSSKPSLYVKDENLNASSIDSKFNENILPLVSSITTPNISCPMSSFSSDMKIDKSPGDKLLKNNSSLTFSEKSLKTDSFSDLDGIDIMRLPVDLGEPGNIDILDDIVADMKPDLLQDTHACYLSLIRDVFCSTPDHRTTLESLHGKISAWVANPITALNDWYGLADSWLDLLQSAVHFLAGEFHDQPDDFVPYIEYKSNLNIYQWIGAGRDRDQHLKQLCEYWLTRRNEMGIKSHSKFETEIIRSKPNNVVSIEESRANTDRVVSPPPLARCPTNWVVQKASPEEIVEFREQERKRFDHPDKAFTYRMHGYESVVGPVKGIYTQIPAMTKARGHNMLTTDRPSFVTILTLVRDATARLPNGEGTRTDICELLKSSQYICPSASETVLQTIVSGALDRMHTENDPCVRYDSKKKNWIYLHRNRTEEEFEVMHQQFQGLSKHKKQNTRKSKVKNSTPKTPETNLTENNLSSDYSESLINSPSAPLSNAAIPIGTTPKKKVTIKTIPAAQGIVAISGSSHLVPTNAQSMIPATVKLTQPPAIISSMSSLPVPALSTINSPTLTTNPPPLINKVITTQKKTIIKPELVPIQQIQQMNEANIETMDIESTLENAPIIISKSPTVQNQQSQITGIIIDKNQKINTKIVGKPSIGIVSAAPTSAAQIKVSTAGGIQTVHVSPGHTLIKSQQGQTTLLQTGGNKSILATNQVRRSQHGKALPPLVAAAQSPTNHSYVIPISIGKSISSVSKTFQPVVAQTSTKSISPKTIKTSTVPILTTSNNMQRTSLLQTQTPQIVSVSGNKTIIRTAANTVPAGKSLINPSAIAANRQQQATMQIIQAKSLSQQNIIVSPGGANIIGGNQKATIVGTSSPIMVQKIIAVSKTGTNTSNAGSMVTSQSICNVNTIGTTTTATPPGTSLINPQIIQIHQTNQDKSPATAKVQTISTANLSPLQQQSLFQSINKHIRVQGIQQSGAGQQNLIIKPQQLLTQIQKQIQMAPVQANSPLIDGTQIQLVSTASGSIAQPIISRAGVKATTSLVQTAASHSPITSVRTVSANSPLIGKVITDQSGQIISLENLVQQNKVNMPSVRIATAKPGQTTNLIQLAPGSQMTQYAVVSIPQQRLVTTQSVNTSASSLSGQVVSVSGVKTASGVSVLSNVTASASKPEIVKIGGKTTMISHPTIIHSQSQPSGVVTPKIVQSAQLQPITAQQLVNAKVLGVQGFQGISHTTQLNQRVKTGSIRNLNIANIDGKPIIIAKAPTQMIQSPGQISKSSLWTQQGNNVGKANIIGTLPAGSQQVMFGNQIVKIQPQQSIATVRSGNVSSPTMSVININANSANNTVTNPTASASTGPRTVVLGSTGQAIKVQAPTMMTTAASDKPTIKNIIKGAAPGQRVVLVQGGNQFILPQNFQGGTINLKSLQGLKMIPIQQTTQIQSNLNSQITGNQAIKPPNSGTGDS